MGSNTRRATGGITGDNTQSTWDNTDYVRITEPIHDEWLAAVAARDEAEPLSRLLDQVVGPGISGRLSRGQRAARAWLAANGDTERRHTCGVYLRATRAAGADPVLFVYVDSSARLTDFRANKDVYLARLANAGLAVSDVEFRLSRKRGTLYAAAQGDSQPRGGVRGDGQGEPLPALTPQEEARVSELVADLPEGLKESASRAISNSLRREKIANTQKGRNRA